jgi:Ubiquitin carboxyl-terminal hydrolase, family 1
MLVLQMIPNSCATHALVSILLNCPELELGKQQQYRIYINNTLQYFSICQKRELAVTVALKYGIGLTT